MSCVMIRYVTYRSDDGIDVLMKRKMGKMMIKE
jgi:hypothetical protein